MKMSELYEVCSFSKEPEIIVINNDYTETAIEWNNIAEKWVSNDYKYIYDDNDDIIDVTAGIMLSLNQLDKVEIVSVNVGSYYTTIKVKL